MRPTRSRGRPATRSLFGVIGTSYGAGDGSITFNLPDLQGRVPVGLSPGGKIEVNTLGNSEGLAASLRNISHHHAVQASGTGTGGLAYGYTDDHGHPLTSGDSDTTDEPAFLVVTYIVKT